MIKRLVLPFVNAMLCTNMFVSQFYEGMLKKGSNYDYDIKNG